MNLCGEQLNEHLKSKLMSTADVRFPLIDWVLKRNYADMEYGKLEREVTTLWRKYKARQCQFAYLCAVGVALVPFSLDLKPAHKLYGHLKIIEALDDTINMLPSLGALVVAYPKIAYLNVTITEFMQMKLSVLSFFGDHSYTELHKFWQTIEQETLQDDDDEHQDQRSGQHIEMGDLHEVLTELKAELKNEFHALQKESMKDAIMEELKETLKIEIKGLIDGKLKEELTRNSK